MCVPIHHQYYYYCHQDMFHVSPGKTNIIETFTLMISELNNFQYKSINWQWKWDNNQVIIIIIRIVSGENTLSWCCFRLWHCFLLLLLIEYNYLILCKIDCRQIFFCIIWQSRKIGRKIKWKKFTKKKINKK